MAFTVVSWSNGDVLTKAKLDQMVANDVLVYDEAIPIVTAQMKTLPFEISPGAYTATLAVSVNTGDISLGGTTSTAGGNSGITADVDISSLVTGIHTIDITLSDTNDIDSAKFRFYKSAAMDFLTCYYTVYETQDSANVVGSASVSVIGHYIERTWT